jgi:hypothetical protein
MKQFCNNIYFGGVTRQERIRNVNIRQELTELREKIWESRLRWYGHMKRMKVKELVRWAMEHKEPGTRSRGRPRKRWMDCIRDDGRVVDLDKVNDRVEWSKVTRPPGQTGWWWFLSICIKGVTKWNAINFLVLWYMHEHVQFECLHFTAINFQNVIP